jgi:hypothetical protein
MLQIIINSFKNNILFHYGQIGNKTLSDGIYIVNLLKRLRENLN